MSASKSKIPMRIRALIALAADAPEGELRSVATATGDFLLLTDTPGGDGKGAECYLEFPSKSGRAGKGALALNVDFSKDGDPLLEGKWTTEITVGGRPILTSGEWTTACEEFDDSYAYVERTVAFEDGRRFSRRFLFAYNEALLLIFDEIDGSDSDRENIPTWRYKSALPIASSLSLLQNAESREITVGTTDVKTEVDAQKAVPKKNISEEERLLAEIAAYKGKSKPEQVIARIFPLTLPEWRADKTCGDLVIKPNSLEFTAVRQGKSLTAGLLVDLNARRAARPCTWRPLTVGEKMEPVDEDAAVGRKIKLGQEQYVLYASTSPYPAIRSIMSRHLLSDFMFGKFTVSRGVTPIVDVGIENE